MIDADYFLAALPMQVLEHDQAACVLLVTHDGDYLVRDVVRVFGDSVALNVWLDSNGGPPIVPRASRAFEVLPPAEFKSVTIPFERIVEAVVAPARESFGRFSLQ